MIWAKEETLPRDELEALQLRKLKKTVSYIYARVSPYRKKWKNQESDRKIFVHWMICGDSHLQVKRTLGNTIRWGCLRWTKRN